jgi:hypothetical protein
MYRGHEQTLGHSVGYSVSGAGDVNGDGFADLLVGAPLAYAGAVKNGIVYIFSGKTGQALNYFIGGANHDNLGFSVASAGNLDHDSRADIIIGAPGAGPINEGMAYISAGRPCNCADFNGDSDVDHLDLEVLQSYYFECGPPPIPQVASDLNCDGAVDLVDAVILSLYLSGTGPGLCCE